MTKHEAHTPEPWEAKTPCPGECCWTLQRAVEDEYGLKTEISSPELSQEDARRIVACVNACAGIETYALELMTGELSILNQISATTPEKLTPKATQYRQQRDKLLAVLVDLVNQPQDITTPAYQSALAVIQECEK